MNDTLTPQQIENHLAQFTGSGNLYRHWTNRIVFTDGIKEMAEICGAYWLIDLVASHMSRKLMDAADGFHVWTVKRVADKEMPDRVGFNVVCQRDTGTKPLVSQDGEFTTFPLDEFKFYVADGGPGGTIVMLLTSEY